MRITKLTVMAFGLIGAVDSGKYDDITIAQIHSRIDDGTILDFVQQKLEPDFTLNVTALTPSDKLELVDELQRYSNAYAASDFAVERQGLCLLLAYILDGVQQRVRES